MESAQALHITLFHRNSRLNEGHMRLVYPDIDGVLLFVVFSTFVRTVYVGDAAFKDNVRPSTSAVLTREEHLNR